MYISKKKLSVDIFTVGHLQNLFMKHDFWDKRKINNVLAIATNIPQRLKTGFMLQGHICIGGISNTNY